MLTVLHFILAAWNSLRFNSEKKTGTLFPEGVGFALTSPAI